MKKVAVPVQAGKLCTHFGHCEVFSIFTVENGKIESRDDVPPPPHQPGVLPVWLAENGVTDVLAGGMGQHAIDIFHQNNIEVKLGVQPGDAEALVKQFLEGSLTQGSNYCDH